MSILAPEATSVYRYYDQAGVLLYVGITARRTRRQTEHRSKDWWLFVSSQRVEHYNTRSGAELRERELIHQFRPPFNKAHNPDHESLRTVYLSAAESLPVHKDRQRPESEKPQDAWRAVRGKVPLDQVERGSRAVFTVPTPYRDLVMSSSHVRQRVLLRAPRKQGELLSVDTYTDPITLTFANAAGVLPQFRDVLLHVKVVRDQPFRTRLHEAVGEVA